MRKILKIIFSIVLTASLLLASSKYGIFELVGADTMINVGFTIIPTKVVSDISRVELRSGLTNNSGATKSLTVEFLVDGQIVKTNNESVASKGYIVSKYWWSAKGSIGCKVLGMKVKDGQTVIAEAYRIITVIDIDTVGPAISTVAWEEPLAYRDGIYKSLRAIKKADVANQVEDMYNLGIDTIIFIYSEFILYNTGAFYDSDLPALTEGMMPVLNYDLLDTILKAAQDRGMNVMVGIGRGKDLFTPINDPGFTKAVDLATDVMEEIYNKYGYYKSFYGWYISHEPSNLSDRSELKFANAVIAEGRRNWPDKAVLIAPSGTPIMDQTSMKNSQIDIFAFQDAVGPGYIPGEYTYDPENRIKDLDEAFSSYKVVMDKIDKHYWSDTESWEMEGPNYENAYPALWSRFERQLNIEKKYVSVQSMYAFTGFLANPKSTVQVGGAKAVALYNGYSEYAKSYMKNHDIHNHTIVKKILTLTVKNISEADAALPSLIEVETAECGIKIKVPVVWGMLSISGTTAIVKGTINTPGIKTATVTMNIVLQSENSQISKSNNPVSLSGVSSAVSGSISGSEAGIESDSISTLASTVDSVVSSGSLQSLADLSENISSSSNSRDKTGQWRYIWIFIIAGTAILIGAGFAVKKSSYKNRLK